MSRRKRAWPTDTYPQRLACIAAVAFVLFTPAPTIIFVAQHVAHLLHH